MRAVRLSFIQMLVSIKHDIILVAACIAPLLCGIFFKFGIPIIENFLTGYFGKESILASYYGMFDLFFSILSPLMFVFVAAMVILEEKDDHISSYLFITPLGKKGYLFCRLGIPAMFGFFVTLVFLPIFKLTDMSIFIMLWMAAAGSAQGLITAMLTVSFSTNKLEGMAVTKLSSLMIIGMVVPYFIGGDVQYLLFFLPSFWMAKAVREGECLFLILSLVVSCIWCGCLTNRFRNKTEK